MQVVVRNGKTLVVIRDPREEELLEAILVRLKLLNQKKLGVN